MLDLGYDKYYRFVWSYKGNLKIPGNPIIVNRDCEDYYKYLATSKYLINNISFSLKEKRKGAIYLQTTHGTPLKYMGIDIKNKSSKIVKGEIVKEPKNWNYLIASNQYAHDIFKRAFRFKNKILDTGYPANDVFYNENKENKVKKIKKLLNITSNKKIILYAPTFRDIKKNIEGEHCFEIPLNLNKLYEKFNDEYIILLRLHYLISDNIELDDKLKNFTINVSDYDDIHELLLIADMLITDYSSVFFDYAHSKKPILFFIPDFDEYKSTRGIYLDIDKDFPGPHFSNNEGLIKGIENIEKIEEDYKDKYKTFYRTYCALSHGNSSKKVIEEVFEGRVDD